MSENAEPYGESAIERLVREAGYAYNLPGETVDAEPVLVDCQYCQGKHEKGQVEYCPLNPHNNPPQSISGIFTVEEVAPFDQAYFDKLLTGFSGIRRRDLLYGSWVSSREKPAISITHNLRTRVNEHGGLVIILEMHGDRMQETLAPGQVINMFLAWLGETDPDTHKDALERLDKYMAEGR